MVKRINEIGGIEVTHDYRKKFRAIPNPATYTIELAEEISKGETGSHIRLYSDYPFPDRQEEGGPRDAFEREALRALRQNPTVPFFRREILDKVPTFRYAEAIVMEPSCVACHNSHPDSPKTDWKTGDVRGVLEVIDPLDVLARRTQTNLHSIFVLLGGLALVGALGFGLVLGRVKQTAVELERQVQERTLQLQEANDRLVVEQDKSEKLLLNILPASIAEQLREGRHNIADGFNEVTILFADIVGFTQLSAYVSPEKLVGMLNEIFSQFDGLCDRHGVEKIKTIGDAYMVAAGLPIPRADHAAAIAEMALDMRSAAKGFRERHDIDIRLRIGINTGPAVAGTIGKSKFIYDLWGDAVNIASRMESHGIPDKIQVTETTYAYLKETYRLEERGWVTVKGKGEMRTYFLVARLPEAKSIEFV